MKSLCQRCARPARAERPGPSGRPSPALPRGDCCVPEDSRRSPAGGLSASRAPWRPSSASPTRPRAGTGSSGESGACGAGHFPSADRGGLRVQPSHPDFGADGSGAPAAASPPPVTRVGVPFSKLGDSGFSAQRAPSLSNFGSRTRCCSVSWSVVP